MAAATDPGTSLASLPVVGQIGDAAGEAQQVRAFLDRHGLAGLADVHTHFMPDPVIRRVWQYFDDLDGHPHLSRVRWPIVYRGDEAQRLATLRSLSVRRFSSLLYPHKPGMATWLNAWSARFAAANPDCASTATFFAEPDAPAYVGHALDAGARVFKCHVQVGGFDPSSPVLDGVWGRLADTGVPTVIHCGSGPEPGRYTGAGPVRAVLERHRRLRLVVAHLGMPEYADFVDLAEAFPGVHLDTTMVFTDFIERLMPFPRGLLPRLADLGDKVVLGSDFPNIPYRFVHQLEALERLGFGSDWLRAVCWDNGIGLLGSPGAPEPCPPPPGTGVTS